MNRIKKVIMAIAISVLAPLAFGATSTVEEAVDNTSLSFALSGDANWYGQDINYFYGIDAAQSGDIIDYQTSVMETTVSGVSGVSFYWNVSSESGWDFLRFYIDTVMQDEISGTGGSWTQMTYALNAGPHVLRWEYSKDSSWDDGLDCGWVDYLQFFGTPTNTPTATPSITGTPPTETITRTPTIIVTYYITPGTGSAWELAVDPAAFSERVLQSSVEFNGRMWLIGGLNQSSVLFNDVWSSYDGITWAQETAAAAFSGRAGHSSVAFNNKMWVIGGIDASGPLNDVWSSVDGINWVQETAAAPFVDRGTHASVVYDGRMWVIGGQGYSMFNDVWSSTDGVNWAQETAAAAFPARFGHASAVHDNKIWVMNGTDNNVEYNDVWYSADGANWTQVTASAPYTARAYGALLSYRGKMWVIAGGDSSSTVLNDVWSSPDGVTWAQETAAANFSPRMAHSGMVFLDRMWVIGGSGGSFITYRDVWYSPPGPFYTPTVSPTGTMSATITPTITGTPPTETSTPTVTQTATPGGPVCAGAFGKTTLGSTSANISGGVIAMGVNLPQAGAVKAISVHVTVAGGGSVRTAIFSDNAGLPGIVLIESTESFPVAAGWHRVVLPDISLAAGNYWLAMQTDGNIEVSYDMPGAYISAYDTQAYGPFISPWSQTTTFPISMAMYAEYCQTTPTSTITGTPPTETSTPTCTPTYGPVCPDQFGTTAVNGTTGYFDSYVWANIYNLPQAGTIKMINVYLYSIVPGKRLRAAVYSNNSGIDALLTESAEHIVSAAGWQRIPVPDTTLPAGMYWIAIQENTGPGIDYHNDAAYIGVYFAQSFGPFTDPAPSFHSTTNHVFTMYAEYCPIGATPTVTGTPPAALDTPTISPTGTASSTETAAQTGTYTVTMTPTETGTPTFTVTGTATETITGTPPTETSTPTVSETSTVTQTDTGTPTESVTDTASTTVTLTATATNTGTATETATGTVTVTATGTFTVTQSHTMSPVASATDTEIPTMTATGTFTHTPTVTLTHSVSPTFTSIMTRTYTPTYTMTPTPVVSATVTETLTLTVTLTATTGGTSTPTAVITETTLAVREPGIYPNPVNVSGAGTFYAGYYLTQDTGGAVLKIFTASFRKVADIPLGGADAAGRKMKPLPVNDLGVPAGGTYYYIIEASGSGGEKARSKAEVLILLK